MANILNLTQHMATGSQFAAGVFEPLDKNAIQEALTFTKVPSRIDIQLKAELLASIAFKELYRQVDIDDLTDAQTDVFNLGPHGPAFRKVIGGTLGFKAMIAGAPYLMYALEYELHKVGITPVYSFSERRSVEKEVDGVVTKTNVFEHIAFIEG